MCTFYWLCCLHYRIYPPCCRVQAISLVKSLLSLLCVVAVTETLPLTFDPENNNRIKKKLKKNNNKMLCSAITTRSTVALSHKQCAVRVCSIFFVVRFISIVDLKHNTQSIACMLQCICHCRKPLFPFYYIFLRLLSDLSLDVPISFLFCDTNVTFIIVNFYLSVLAWLALLLF